MRRCPSCAVENFKFGLDVFLDAGFSEFFEELGLVRNT
jgi:hypothetical protein